MDNIKSMFSTRRPSIDPDAIINLQILLESKKQSTLLDSLQKMMEKTLHEDSVIQKAQLLFQYKTDKDMREDDKRMSSKLSRLLEESKLHTELLSKIDSKLVSKEDALELKRIQEEQLKLAREQSLKRGSIQPKDSPQVQLGGFGKAIALALATGIAAFTAQIKTIGLFARAFVNAMPLAVRKAIANFAIGVSMAFDNVKATIIDKIKKVVSIVDSGIDAIKAFFSGEGKIVTFIRTAFGYARSFLTTLIEPFVALGRWVGKASALSGLFEPVMKVFSYFKTFATSIGKLAGILGKIFYPLTVILTIWDTVKGAFEGFEKDGIVGALKGAIKGFFNSLIFGLADLVKSAVSWLLGALGFDGLEKMLDSFSFTDVFSTIVDTIFGPLQLMQDIVVGLAKFITSPIETLKSLGEKISSGFEVVKDLAGKLLDAYLFIPKKIISLVDDYIIEPFKTIFEPVTNFFTNIKDKIVSFFEDFKIPEIGFTIPFINKKISIGPFYPFRSDNKSQEKTSDAGGSAPKKDMGPSPNKASDAGGSAPKKDMGPSPKKAGPNWNSELKRLEDKDASTPADHLEKQYPGVIQKYKELAKNSTPRSDSFQSIETHEQALVVRALGEISKGSGNAKPFSAVQVPNKPSESKATQESTPFNEKALATKALSADQVPKKAGPVPKKAGPNWNAILKHLEETEDAITPVDHLEKQYPGVIEKYKKLAKNSVPRSDSFQSIQIHEQALALKALSAVQVPNKPSESKATQESAERAEKANTAQIVDKSSKSEVKPSEAKVTQEPNKTSSSFSEYALFQNDKKLYSEYVTRKEELYEKEKIGAAQIYNKPPAVANMVYDKSAEVASSSQSMTNAPTVVSAPTNVVSQNQNISMPKHTRNQDSTYSRYQRNNFVAID